MRHSRIYSGNAGESFAGASAWVDNDCIDNLRISNDYLDDHWVGDYHRISNDYLYDHWVSDHHRISNDYLNNRWVDTLRILRINNDLFHNSFVQKPRRRRQQRQCRSSFLMVRVRFHTMFQPSRRSFLQRA